MKIIIAPSKTLKPRKVKWSSSELIFPKQTQYLRDILKQYNDEELCQLMKISSKQSQIVYDYFQNDHDAYPALGFFSGTVFKQMIIEEYDIKDLEYLEDHVHILCALHGVLKYNTNIQPYRLDMTMKPNSIHLYDYWYTELYNYFKDEDFIISLASHEFTSMINHPHLYFIDFIVIDDQKIKRPSMQIKKLRGMMLHHCIKNKITTIEQLKQISVDGFTYNEDYSHDNTIGFTFKK